jgi:signal transduction histidine kinase
VARRLPPAVDLAAYRIVQEALTNVVRHAGPATAMVRLTYDRVAALGGRLEAGPRPAGGFRVLATLPPGRHGVKVGKH